MSAIHSNSLAGVRLRLRAIRQARQGANLDAAFTSSARRRNLRRPLNGFVQVLAIEDVIPGKLLLCLRERSVCDQRFPVLHANGGRVCGGAQWLSTLQDALSRSLLYHCPVSGLLLFRLRRRRTAEGRSLGSDRGGYAKGRL